MTRRPYSSDRRVLLVLPVGLDEAYTLQRFDVDVLNRKGSLPPSAKGRRVALYAGTRIGGRDFFGAPNRAARNRLVKALALRIQGVHAGMGYAAAEELAPYAQRVVATAVIEGDAPTATSPWWDGQSMAWKLRDVKKLSMPLPLEGGALNGFRTLDEDHDTVEWLGAVCAIRDEDLGPCIPTRRRS